MEAHQILVKIFGQGHPALSPPLSILGGVLWRQGKLEQAEATFNEVLQLEVSFHGPDHMNAAATLGNVANVLSDQGKLKEAKEKFEAAN